MRRSSQFPTSYDARVDRSALFERARWAVLKAMTTAVVRSIVRLHVTGTEHVPPGPAILCFSHQSWTDPFILAAAVPRGRRLRIYGPKEEDMRVGVRNRLIRWSGAAVPFRPQKDDLLTNVRAVRALLREDSLLGIAGEGRIHAGEATLLPLEAGPAYLALSSGVPLLPVAINGTGWITLGRVVRVRFGEPLEVEGRASRAAVEALTARTWERLHELVQGYPEPAVPGRIGRWFTELFNDWPEGERPESRRL